MRSLTFMVQGKKVSSTSPKCSKRRGVGSLISSSRRRPRQRFEGMKAAVAEDLTEQQSPEQRLRGNLGLPPTVSRISQILPEAKCANLKTVVVSTSQDSYGIAINSRDVPVFCEFGTNKMASINPKSMEITEYNLPQGARPRRMAIDANDAVYFTDYQDGNLGWLDLSTGAVKMWPSPGGSGSAPYGITITPDGMVWYSESRHKTEHDYSV